MLLDEQSIPTNTLVRVRLRVDARASGSAVLAIAWSGGGHTGGHAECRAAPGGSCEAAVTPGMRGLLRIMVDMSAETDKGTLGVQPLDTSVDFQGDQSWLFVVE